MASESEAGFIHHVGYRLAHPAVPRLAARGAALKEPSRRASARWPRKNEAILDRGGARCLGMFRPGRENGTPAEPENGDCGRRLANASATTNGGHLYVVPAGRVYRLRGPGNRRQNPGCVQFSCLRRGVQRNAILCNAWV